VLALAAGGPGGGAEPPASGGGEGIDHLPNVPLVTHEGKAVRFYDDLVRDRIVMINFFYAGCGDICPLTTQHLVEVQELLGDRVGRDIFMYSISLQPELDTPKILTGYVETYGVRPGWLFLTGTGPDTELLRRRLGFTDPDPELDADLLQHTGMVKFGNDAIGRWAACPALAEPPEIVRGVLRMDPLPASA
jgi:protein SCO1